MYFVELDEIEAFEPVPGFSARILHSGGLTVAHWTIQAGSLLPEHDHPHEMVVNVIDGELELTVAGETRVLGPAMCAVIPGCVPHSAVAVTDCRVVDVWQPRRTEYPGWSDPS